MMDMMALHTMLDELREDEKDADNDASRPRLQPNTIAKVAAEKRKPSRDVSDTAAPQSDIWDDAEVDTATEAEMKIEDGRKRPEFDVAYKQCVGAEDVYLGMGGMDPSSNCCSHLVVKVKLPGEKLHRIELEVKNQVIRVYSPTYKLVTYLPYPVEESEGKAKWDAEKSCLSVTLRISRE